MKEKCDHWVGWIPAVGEVNSTSWGAELIQFANKVLDFNVRGQRQQINHPGFIEEYRFCSRCAHPIDRSTLLSYGQAMERLENKETKE